jgi:hypothetical protein
VKKEDGNITDRSDYNKKFENIIMTKRKKGETTLGVSSSHGKISG